MLSLSTMTPALKRSSSCSDQPARGHRPQYPMPPSLSYMHCTTLLILVLSSNPTVAMTLRVSPHLPHQCGNVTLTAAHGTPPLLFLLLVYNGSEAASGPTTLVLGRTTVADRLSWIVDLPGPMRIQFQVNDSNGTTVQSDINLIAPGSDTCLHSRTPTSLQSPSSPHYDRAGWIAGTAVGAFILLLLVSGLLYWRYHRDRRLRRGDSERSSDRLEDEWCGTLDGRSSRR
ncbi:hypothetical protein C8Q80DRAFT_448946 [Daedaleopsis nitida]|nr:hypothetical protein C8Q80DRAFT_448946 [Daedaleopsis nitida]